MSSSDLTKPVIKTLEYLMLAQAAECYWQKAVMGLPFTICRNVY